MEEKNEKIETTEEVVKVEEKVVTQEPIIEENTPNNGKGFSIASMVLGIVSIVCLGQLLISIACGVLAIIFGLKGKQREGKGMAKAGFILGIISLSIIAVLFLWGLFLGITIASIMF